MFRLSKISSSIYFLFLCLAVSVVLASPAQLLLPFILGFQPTFGQAVLLRGSAVVLLVINFYCLRLPAKGGVILTFSPSASVRPPPVCGGSLPAYYDFC